MKRWDVLRVVANLHRKEGRNAAELRLYTLDDLRRLYQATEENSIRLRDGIVSRVQLAAVIRWRHSSASFERRFTAIMGLVAAVAAVIAAVEGWPPAKP